MQVVRLKQLAWINEIESEKFVAHLIKSKTITGAKLQTNFEVPDSETPRCLKKIINGDFERRVIIQEEAAQTEKRFLTGRQVAWMIYEYFKVIDTDDSVLDLVEILMVELNNDNVLSFNTRWDETIIAVRTEPPS